MGELLRRWDFREEEEEEESRMVVYFHVTRQICGMLSLYIWYV